MDDPQEYWRSRAMEATQEYEHILQSQRDELERLQRRCNDLLHERSMMKAATAADVRNFCLNYQADQQRKQSLTTTAAVEEIPLHTLMQFLHTYSNGLLPAPENKRKRSRLPTDDDRRGSSSTQPPHAASASAAASGLPISRCTNRDYYITQQQQQQQHRLYQRMLARQRTTGRLEDLDENQDAAAPVVTSSEASANPSSDTGGRSAAAQRHEDPSLPDSQEEALHRAAMGGGGGDGPVTTAPSMFGLPPHPFPK